MRLTINESLSIISHFIVILSIGDVVSYDDATNAVVFTGVNVQIINGTNYTGNSNGLGNLIVGYNEKSTRVDAYCSNGRFSTQKTCVSPNVWGLSQRTGSHNLIVGYGNDYTQYGAIVGGLSSISNARAGSILGGYMNSASGDLSTVSGGERNAARNYVSTVIGGNQNLASGRWSIVGGNQNSASGELSSVFGGAHNVASWNNASVTGGYNNTASGEGSSITGGMNNTVSGIRSTISGGLDVDLPDWDSWAAGSLRQ